MQQMRHVGIVAYVVKNVFSHAQNTDSDMYLVNVVWQVLVTVSHV